MEAKTEPKSKKTNHLFKKGHKPSPQSGRKKGQKNRITIEMKKAIYEAFEKLGGVEYLVKLGNEKPELFVRLMQQVVPAEIKSTITSNATLTIKWDGVGELPNSAKLINGEVVQDAAIEDKSAESGDSEV